MTSQSAAASGPGIVLDCPAKARPLAGSLVRLQCCIWTTVVCHYLPKVPCLLGRDRFQGGRAMAARGDEIEHPNSSTRRAVVTCDGRWGRLGATGFSISTGVYSTVHAPLGLGEWEAMQARSSW